MSAVHDRVTASRAVTTTGKTLSLLASCAAKPYRENCGAHLHDQPCPGSWEALVPPHRGLRLAFASASVLPRRKQEGPCLPEQKAKEAEAFLSKGFSFLDDLIAKVCTMQISQADLWQRACQGKGQEAASSSGWATGHL